MPSCEATGIDDIDASPRRLAVYPPDAANHRCRQLRSSVPGMRTTCWRCWRLRCDGTPLTMRGTSSAAQPPSAATFCLAVAEHDVDLLLADEKVTVA